MMVDKQRLISSFAKECNIEEHEVLDWYGLEFEKYCKKNLGDCIK